MILSYMHVGGDWKISFDDPKWERLLDQLTIEEMGNMIAAAWSDELAMAFGESIGKMADEMDTVGWYAPAMNIHRIAFSGRNFE